MTDTNKTTHDETESKNLEAVNNNSQLSVEESEIPNTSIDESSIEDAIEDKPNNANLDKTLDNTNIRAASTEATNVNREPLIEVEDSNSLDVSTSVPIDKDEVNSKDTTDATNHDIDSQSQPTPVLEANEPKPTPNTTPSKKISKKTPNNPLPKRRQPTIFHKTFLTAFLDTLASALKDKGAVLMLIFAPIIYGFFYPWPYNSEVVTHVPVAIVDNDHSELSKTITRYSQASPQLDVRTYHTQDEAQLAMYKGDIAGYLIIPNNLQQKVYASKPVHVTILGNNSYFLINKNVQSAFTKAISTVSAGVEVKRMVAQGTRMETAKVSTQAVPLRVDPMFNRSEGYGAYVVPAVSILILQQTLLMGTALLIGTWYEKRQQNASVTGWIGRILALSTINFIMACFYYGWVFTIQDYPRGHNMLGTLLFFALFAPTVATLGCVLGMWFRQRERSLQLLVFSSLPIFFVSGYPWPVSQLPVPIQYIRWLLPSTSGMNASVQLNQMGASLSQVRGYLFTLIGLWLFFFLLLMLIQRLQIKRIRNAST